jgi:ribosome-binding factor A
MLYRDKRVAEALRSEIAKIITFELADPNLGFVTVVGVRLAKDLKHATVYVSVIGDEPKKKLTVDHLERARGYIKNRLADRIVLRYMPDIHFRFDELLAQEERISEVISQLHREETPGKNDE